MEQPGLERIIRLFGLLIGNKRSTKVLAEILECDLRTVQRYLQLLKITGFLVEYHTRGVPYLSANRGRLRDISQLLHFNPEEAFILHKAIDSIGGDTLLKQNLRKKLYSIYNFPEMVDIVTKPELGETVHRLIEAIRDEKAVKLIGYQSANSNTVSDRVVEPYQFTTNYAQVWCFDLKDNQCKLFTTTRICEVETLHHPWQHKKKHLAAGLDVFRNSGNTPAGTVILKLNVRAASLLVEEYPLAERYLRQTESAVSFFETQVYNFEGPARFVLGLFDNIEVQGDESFKNFIHKKISSLKF